MESDPTRGHETPSEKVVVSLDSTFLIDLLRRRPAALRRAEEFRRSDTATCIAPPAAVEVLTGGHRIGGEPLRKAEELLASLPVLAFDGEAIETCARLAAELIERGEYIGEGDLLIAGISLRHGEKLVTRDQAFSRIPGLLIEFY